MLLALASDHAHGYAVMRFVEQLTGGALQLGAGTLYRTIGRLLANGLVEEAARLAQLVEAAARAGLLP